MQGKKQSKVKSTVAETEHLQSRFQLCFIADKVTRNCMLIRARVKLRVLDQEIAALNRMSSPLRGLDATIASAPMR